MTPPGQVKADLVWDEDGGSIQNGSRVVPLVCGIPNNLYAENDTYTSNPWDHQPPTADVGGPAVNEGSTVQLDGTGTNDPEGNPLTYQWFPQGNLDDPALAQPTYTGVDDLFGLVVLYVYDQTEALYSSEFTSITVNNVPPSVIAVGDAADEGEPATVQATFTDPGLVDTHSATIDWGDGMGPQAVSLQQLGSGVQHVYGDNATFERRLEDGTRFRVVKVPHTVADLQRRLRELGWAAEVHQTAGPFYRGTA